MQRRSLSEEESEKIDLALARMEKGDIIAVYRYKTGKYEWLRGTLTKLVLEYRYIEIGKNKVYFEDIADIKIE